MIISIKKKIFLLKWVIWIAKDKKWVKIKYLILVKFLHWEEVVNKIVFILKMIKVRKIIHMDKVLIEEWLKFIKFIRRISKNLKFYKNSSKANFHT